MLELIVLAALAQCQPQPGNCYTDYSQVYLFYEMHDEDAWPYWSFDLWARTGWNYGVPGIPCDVEHGFMEWNPNPRSTSDHRTEWPLYPIPGADDLYITYADTMRDSQHEFYLGRRMFRLAEVIHDDPKGEPYGTNAGWLIALAVNNDPGDTEPDMWLGCPNRDAQNQIGAFWYSADEWACPADLTDDGRVDVADFLQLLEEWASEENPEGFDVADFMYLLAHWGGCPLT